MARPVFKNIKKRGKDFAKRTWGILFYFGGFFHLIRQWNNIRGKRLTILMYHRVSKRDISNMKDSQPFLFVSEASFEKQLLLIKKWFHVIGFEELDQYVKVGRLPRNSLIITFDDGYEDNYSVAYKILRKHGLKACFFIPTSMIGIDKEKRFWWDRAVSLLQRRSEASERERDSDQDTLFYLYEKFGDHFFAELGTWDTRMIEGILDATEGKGKILPEGMFSENRLLNWSQVLEMSREMEIGSHTCSHMNLCTLPSEKVEKEIRESQVMIEERTGIKVLAFSYPGGNRNKDTIRMVENSGYKFAVSTLEGVNSLKGLFYLRRIAIWEGTAVGPGNKFCKGFFAFKILGY